MTAILEVSRHFDREHTEDKYRRSIGVSGMKQWLEIYDWHDLLKTVPPASERHIVVKGNGAIYPTNLESRNGIEFRDLNAIPDQTLGAIWLSSTRDDLELLISTAWPKLKNNGVIGGPAFGMGLPGIVGKKIYEWNQDNSKLIRQTVSGMLGSSELLLGLGETPCWCAFRVPPQPESVLLISGSDATQKGGFGELSKLNHQKYAAQNGYNYYWSDLDSEFQYERHKVWAKIALVRDALIEGKWDQVWWIDADAVFCDMSRELDKFVHPNWSGVFPQYVHRGRVMASSGVWAARKKLIPGLDDTWNRSGRGYGVFSEELCMADSFEQRPELWRDAFLLDHRLFNGVPSKGIWYEQADLNFVVHLSGLDNKARRSVIKGVAV